MLLARIYILLFLFGSPPEIHANRSIPKTFIKQLFPVTHHARSLYHDGFVEEAYSGRTISINPTTTPLFIQILTGLSIFMLILLMTGIFMYKQRNDKNQFACILEKRNEEISLQKKQLDHLHQKYKQQIGFSHLNPHLIFNSLTAIQYFTMMDDKKMANHYLGLLSKFIRMMLRHAGTRFTDIGSEKEMLTQYLDLEQARFNHKFNYHLDVKKTVGKIPSMLIFPFVEEALYERVLATDTNHKKPSLTIIFESSATATFISIVDDSLSNKAGEQSAIITLAEEQINDVNNYHAEKIIIERNYAPANNQVSIRIPHSMMT